jgi:hypothetical protein
MMQQPEKPKPDCDVAYLFHGQRTPPGPVIGFTDLGGLMVQRPDGRSYPYAPHELDAADA